MGHSRLCNVNTRRSLREQPAHKTDRQRAAPHWVEPHGGSSGGLDPVTVHWKNPFHSDASWFFAAGVKGADSMQEGS